MEAKQACFWRTLSDISQRELRLRSPRSSGSRFAAGAPAAEPPDGGRALGCGAGVRRDSGSEPEHEVEKEYLQHEGEVKQELKLEPVDSASMEKPLLSCSVCGSSIRPEQPAARLTFGDRIPTWVHQCIVFQKSGRTWTPGKPCCMPNFFIEPMSPPPEGQLQSCWHRLTREQKDDLAAFVQGGSAELTMEDMADLHPELAAPKLQRPCLCGVRPYLEQWPWMQYLDRLCGVGGDADESVGSSSPGRPLPPSGEGLQAQSKTRRASSPRSSASGCRLRIHRRPPAARQSGVRNVVWEEIMSCWVVQTWQGSGSRQGGKRKRVIHGRFRARDYSAPDTSLEQAIAAALQAAIAHRQHLLEQGSLQERRAVEYRSDVPGVGWDRTHRRWQVRFPVDGRSVFGGVFRPRDETLAEVERARLLAEARLQELAQQRGLAPGGGRPEEAPPRARAARAERPLTVGSNERGVRWLAESNLWHVTVQFSIGGRVVTHNLRCRPRDLTSEAVEVARRRAVRCRDDLLRIRKRAKRDPRLDVAPHIAKVRAKAKARGR